MNTRDYHFLSIWCEKHFEETNIKIFPSAVPVDLVLEDILKTIHEFKVETAIIFLELAQSSTDNSTLSLISKKITPQQISALVERGERLKVIVEKINLNLLPPAEKTSSKTKRETKK